MSETAVSWLQRVPWIFIRQTCEVPMIQVHPFFNLSMSAYPDDGHNFTGCFGRGRRTPSPQGNSSHRSFLTLPSFTRAFRSSRPTGQSFPLNINRISRFFISTPPHFIFQPNTFIPTIRVRLSMSNTEMGPLKCALRHSSSTDTQPKCYLSRDGRAVHSPSLLIPKLERCARSTVLLRSFTHNKPIRPQSSPRRHR